MTSISVTTSSNFANFLLAELACAAARTRLLTAEIESIRTALGGAFITPDDALNWLDEAGGLGLIAVSITVSTT